MRSLGRPGTVYTHLAGECIYFRLKHLHQALERGTADPTCPLRTGPSMKVPAGPGEPDRSPVVPRHAPGARRHRRRRVGKEERRGLHPRRDRRSHPRRLLQARRRMTTQRVWRPRADTLALIDDARAVLAEAEASGYRFTLRRVYYALVSANLRAPHCARRPLLHFGAFASVLFGAMASIILGGVITAASGHGRGSGVPKRRARRWLRNG